MLINKFNYVPLERDETTGTRLYVLPSNSKVASVTSILSATQSAEKKAGLDNWRKAVGDIKANAIMTEASNRGTRMHKWLETYVLTGDMGKPGTNPYSQQSHKMASIIVGKALSRVSEMWGVEIPLYYDGLYAGTTDALGVIDGTPAILDYKQSNKPKTEEHVEDYYYQLSAYILAHNNMHGTNINKGVVLMCTADYQYQEFMIEGAKLEKYQNLWWDRVEQYYTQTR